MSSNLLTAFDEFIDRLPRLADGDDVLRVYLDSDFRDMTNGQHDRGVSVIDVFEGIIRDLPEASNELSWKAGFEWAREQLDLEYSVTIWSLFDVLYRALDHVPDIEQMDRDHRLLLIKALDFARFVGHVVAGEKLGPDIVVPLGELTDGDPGVSMPGLVTPESKLPEDVTADEVIESMAMVAGIQAEEETRRTLVDAVLTRRGLVRGIKVQS